MIFSLRSRAQGGLVLVLALAAAITSAAPGLSLEESGASPAEQLKAAVAAYDPAKASEGKSAAADAFFLFESSALDRDLGARNPTLYREVEGEWARLLADMSAAKPASEVAIRAERVLGLLASAARAAEAPGSLFFDSLLIILREGFEAILVVSALAAYLRRVGQKDKRPYLFGGALLAVVASFALWFAARTVISVSGAGREAFEGATILVATAVLFWVSYWLISKAEADRWQAFVRSRVEQAIGRGALFGFGFLSFVVVFREGFETVLFYEALAARSGGASGQTLLLSGFLAGSAALGVLYVAFAKLGPKIPMRAFFNVTGGLLYLMAFKFAGAGVRELQDAGIVPITPLVFLPDSSFLGNWLGLYPFAEPLALQAVLLAAAVFAILYTVSGRRAVAAPEPRSRRQAAG